MKEGTHNEITLNVNISLDRGARVVLVEVIRALERTVGRSSVNEKWDDVMDLAERWLEPQVAPRPE